MAKKEKIIIKNVEYDKCSCCNRPISGTGRALGGVAIFVTKDFVRNKKRVTFSDDWQKLCESAGFKTVCRHQAMLVKEEVKDSLFGDKIVKKTERKSFFRRLAESKGLPPIDHEDVICMIKD